MKKIDRVTVPELVSQINAYVAIEGNEVGGNLYMVLSNKNITDDNIKFCLKQATENGDKMGAELAILLLTATKTQRLKACSNWSIQE